MGNKKGLIRKLNAYTRLMRLDKPIGILLLLWPTLWGLLLAGDGRPNWPIVFIFIIGVVLMRSAGCVMNDIADRHYDGHVERTQNRPIVNG
ncbi:MAG: UbiA family prenyltransferase, partial [Methylophilaceae bacterium]|nr:UbiA family prenyltransferase [Methylophilaceae bacterium]